jgi:hypothetical protein
MTTQLQAPCGSNIFGAGSGVSGLNSVQHDAGQWDSYNGGSMRSIETAPRFSSGLLSCESRLLLHWSPAASRTVQPPSGAELCNAPAPAMPGRCFTVSAGRGGRAACMRASEMHGETPPVHLQVTIQVTSRRRPAPICTAPVPGPCVPAAGPGGIVRPPGQEGRRPRTEAERACSARRRGASEGRPGREATRVPAQCRARPPPCMAGFPMWPSCLIGKGSRLHSKRTSEPGPS